VIRPFGHFDSSGDAKPPRTLSPEDSQMAVVRSVNPNAGFWDVLRYLKFPNVLPLPFHYGKKCKFAPLTYNDHVFNRTGACFLPI
jgi:hypothetical protein